MAQSNHNPGYLMPALIAPLVTLSLLSPVVAQADVEQADLRQEVEALKARVTAQDAEIAALRRGDSERWITEQRTEEIRSLVMEVLADAETRVNLLQDGLTAGYNKHFFIASADGNFLMQFYAKLQARFIYNNRGAASGEDTDRWGFENRRTELYWAGHVINPDLTYKMKLAANRSGGSISLDDAVIGYQLDDKWKIDIGQFKIPFLREFLVSSGRQQALERSFINHTFNANRSQGVQLSYRADKWAAHAMVHDGTLSKNTPASIDRTDFAVAGRVEMLLAGEWSQFKDFQSWPDEEYGLLLGAAIDYEVGETGFGTDTPDFFKYTIDLSAEFGGWNLYTAFVGQHVDDNGSASFTDVDQFAFLVQGGLFVIPDNLDVFARYEYINLDGVFYGPAIILMTPVAEDEINIVTAGANYYFNKHALKLTADVVWVIDQLPDSDTGAGLLQSSQDNQIVFRTQLQLMF